MSRASRQRDAQDGSGFAGFGGALLGGSASAGFSAGEIEDGGGHALRAHSEQSASAGLLHVVTVGGDGENVNGGFGQLVLPQS